MKNNFILRALTSVVYVTLVSAGIMLGSYYFMCLFAIITVLCLWEFYGLINSKGNVQINKLYNSFGGLILFLSTYLYASGAFPFYIFYPYFLYIMVVFIVELYEKQEDPISHLAHIFLGQFYIALPLSVLNLIAFIPSNEGGSVYSPLMLLALFVFVWINDTGAYTIGVLFGKHRLFERISPKKSWEGFFGGLAFAIASAFVFSYIFTDSGIPYYHWVGIAASVSIFGTWGDLTESLIKRTLNVKDSGNTMPGHGGFLDRLDSILLAAYAVLFYINIFIQN
ncbi:phosphatidate cytidylyltransferase [Dysgonomonadaceae bacterium PH5-43]|nr:phosphatidate cytidylyltransferase [Dysgonomonadaceae bacterium PH5-43]